MLRSGPHTELPRKRRAGRLRGRSRDQRWRGVAMQAKDKQELDIQPASFEVTQTVRDDFRVQNGKSVLCEQICGRRLAHFSPDMVASTKALITDYSKEVTQKDAAMQEATMQMFSARAKDMKTMARTNQRCQRRCSWPCSGSLATMGRRVIAQGLPFGLQVAAPRRRPRSDFQFEVTRGRTADGHRHSCDQAARTRRTNAVAVNVLTSPSEKLRKALSRGTPTCLTLS